MTDSYDSQAVARRIHELLILGVLRDGPMHGYQIALEVEERSGGYFGFQHGTLYPILHRLEQEGVLGGDWSDPAQGRARKQYALTRPGRRYLERLAREWQLLEGHVATFLEDRSNEQIRPGAA